MDPQPQPQPKPQPAHNKIPQTSLTIPDPVLYDSIQFYDGQRLVKYTDCWEISVLRFLQLVFGRDGRIQVERLKMFMDVGDGKEEKEGEDKEGKEKSEEKKGKENSCQRLLKYFHENPTYSYSYTDYETPHGYKLRAEWCQFLNNSPMLYRKIDGKYEVAATMPNLFAFFQAFFPKIKADYSALKTLTVGHIEDGSLFASYSLILNQIYSQLSQASNFQISQTLETSYIDYQDLFHFNTVQKISLNGVHLLDWEIYQFYNIDEDGVIGARASGHSDYRFRRA